MKYYILGMAIGILVFNILYLNVSIWEGRQK